MKTRVAIVGASGYSGEELVRLLSRHPEVTLAAVTSRSFASQPVSSVLPKLKGSVADALTFTASDAAALAHQDDLDLVFLALPHGVAADYAVQLVAAGKKVIDLSADFRLNSAETYQTYYGKQHPAPELLTQAAYVIPELAGDTWKSAPMVASPGCYPTSILVPLVPLLRAQLLQPEGILSSSMSGISGAGKKLAEDFIFCARNESVKAYGLPKHRHLSEIEEQLSLAAQTPVVVQFLPHLAPMKRGIASTLVARPTEAGIDALYHCWETAFAGKPFINLLPSGQTPDTADVSLSNRVDLSAVYDARTGNVVITSAIDNLLKGASGQAVQIMNQWFGFDETAGLI